MLRYATPGASTGPIGLGGKTRAVVADCEAQHASHLADCDPDGCIRCMLAGVVDRFEANRNRRPPRPPR